MGGSGIVRSREQEVALQQAKKLRVDANPSVALAALKKALALNQQYLHVVEKDLTTIDNMIEANTEKAVRIDPNVHSIALCSVIMITINVECDPNVLGIHSFFFSNFSFALQRVVWQVMSANGLKLPQNIRSAVFAIPWFVDSSGTYPHLLIRPIGRTRLSCRHPCTFLL